MIFDFFKDLIELKKDPKEINQAKNDSEDEKDYDNEKIEEEGLKVTFLCVVFVNESIVTGGDEGFVNFIFSEKLKIIIDISMIQ